MMSISRRPGFRVGLALSVAMLGGARIASAQVPPPPLPPSEEESAARDAPDNAVSGNESSTAGASSDASDPSGMGPSDDPTSPSNSDSEVTDDAATAGASASATAGASGAADDAMIFHEMEPVDEEDDQETERYFRLDSTRRQPSLSGSTGLFHVHEAGSGQAGTFRMQVIGGYYSGKKFLCSPSFPCFDPVTGDPSLRDKAQRSSEIVNISVTPFSFLEAFLTINSSATYNSEGTPKSLQVVGDANFGVKGFMPQKPDSIFTAGGEADMYLMTGTGGVGVAGKATSFAMRALATLDLNNRTDKSKRIPLRVHANLGYFFDNSAQLVKTLEETPPPQGRGARISRTERYGLGISRVDALQIGLGVEYVNPYVRPFIEWTADIPVNRQGYQCVISDLLNTRTAGADQCLKLAAGLGTTPNRLTFGTRVFPWQATGLALDFGVDVGTGGVHRFLDETRPETPYTLWFGVGYTVDVRPPKPEASEVAAEPTIVPEMRRYVLGRVTEEKSGAAVPDAVVRYADVPMTGLIANADGLFISQDLPAGQYTFNVRAEGYKDGSCVAEIPETAPPPAAAPARATAMATDTETATPAPEGPYTDEDGNLMVPLDCKLAQLPPVADITGLLVDGRNGGPVRDATVTIVDKLNRSLTLEVDSAGAFQFRNVPFGPAHIRADAPGYLPTIHPINVASREEIKPHVLMNPRPAKLGVTFTKNEIKLARKIEFVGDTTDMVLDSVSMLEELAVALSDHPEAKSVEIQVHTDDSGAASYSRRLSQERADRIKTLLVDLGVSASRLTAKGYGPDQPLVPNVSDETREKNNRVQFIISKEQP